MVRVGWLMLGLAAALLVGLVPAADAGAAPQLGRWEGEGQNGSQVRFQVMRERGSANRAVTYFTFACTAEGLRLNFYADSRADGGVAPGDTLRPHAFPVSRAGRVGDAKNVISPTLRGRLGRSSGTIKVKGEGCDADNTRVRVHRVAETVERPVSGVWRSGGAPPTDFRFEVFGWGLDYFFGQVLTGFGTAEGVPVPCIRNLGFLDAGALMPAWIGTDGAFAAADDQPGAPASFNGRFDSSRSLTGTYHVSPGGGSNFYLKCVDLPFPYTAELEEAAPRPKLHGAPLVDDSGGPPPPPTIPLPTPSEPTEYVALGDSYSSGEGVRPFDPATATATNRCHRSQRAYSQVFGPPGYALNRTFLACSGAITDNVGRLDAGGAVTGTPQGHDDAGTIQLARLGAEAWQATDLITITIGGNDAQFASVLKRCIVLPCHKGKRAERIKARIANELPPLLASTYAGISRTAPRASVITLGYPQLFPNDPRKRCPIGKKVVSRAKQIFLRERGEQLNAVVRAQAEAAGFHFVDVERAFSGHEPCGRKQEWIHALVSPLGLGPDRGELVFSFHPNEKGQRAYARELTEYLGCLHGEGFPFGSAGVPQAPGTAQPVPADCR